MKNTTLVAVLALGLLALGAHAKPSKKFLTLKEALETLKAMRAEQAKRMGGGGPGPMGGKPPMGGSHSSDSSNSYSSDSYSSDSSSGTDSSSGSYSSSGSGSSSYSGSGSSSYSGSGSSSYSGSGSSSYSGSAIGFFKANMAKSMSSDSGSGSGWDWDFEDWVAYLVEECGVQEDYPMTHGGPVTPDMVLGELHDFAGFVAEAADAIVVHRDNANAVADVMETLDVSNVEDFLQVIIVNTDMFDAFSDSMDMLGHGAMCTHIRLNHLRDRFDFQGAEGFSREGECNAAHYMVKDADDMHAAVMDRDWMVDFSAAMRSDITCAANAIEGFNQTVASELKGADLSQANRREVAGIFSMVGNFMETTGRELYEFAEGVHTVGEALGSVYGEADARAAQMKVAEHKAKKLSSLLDMFYKALQKSM